MSAMKGLYFYGVPRKLSRRILGASIGTQGVAVFLWAIVAHQLANAQGHSGSTAFLWSGIVVAVLCLVASGSLRRPWGVTLGWLVQVACLLACVVVPMMLLVLVFFGGMWVVSMVQGTKIDDLREDAEAKYAQFEREHGHRPDEEPPAAAPAPGDEV